MAHSTKRLVDIKMKSQKQRDMLMAKMKKFGLKSHVQFPSDFVDDFDVAKAAAGGGGSSEKMGMKVFQNQTARHKLFKQYKMENQYGNKMLKEKLVKLIAAINYEYNFCHRFTKWNEGHTPWDSRFSCVYTYKAVQVHMGYD